MKKILKYSCLTLLLVILNNSLRPSNQVFAARPGPCCQAGYDYNPKTGNCLNEEVGNVIDSYAAPATCLALLTSAATNPDIFQSCKDTAAQAYKSILASRPYLEAAGATPICTAFASWMSVSPSVTFERAADVCSKNFAALYQRLNRIVDIEVPTSCGLGSQCDASGICKPAAQSSPLAPYNPTCGGNEKNKGGFEGVKTALGCLPTDPQVFVDTALPWAVGIGAGIAFILGILGAAIIVLSAGNPEKMQAGKEMITSAIAGLLLIIFAIFILSVVGVDLLGLFPNRAMD